jgi:curved DNA-binding protein CbpA
MSDHYEVLGIGRGASKKEIKKKFYELAKQYHPDVNDDPGAEAKFKRINEAYAVLTSDRDRHEYDYNVNYTTSSTVRPKYNYDGSPFYNFDVWYTMHYGM